ncbi:hypothetical protein V6R21_05790 [Limibacter armeniacum]
MVFPINGEKFSRAWSSVVSFSSTLNHPLTSIGQAAGWDYRLKCISFR